MSKKLPSPVEDSPEAVTAKKQHTWMDVGAWESSGPRRGCAVCGIEEIGGGIIRADMEGTAPNGKKAKLFHYRDASGKTLSTFIPLTCPAYLGDVNGAVVESKQRIRNVTGRMGNVEVKVESVEERVSRLEEENEALKARVSANQMEVQDFIQWLGEMVRQHATTGLPAVSVEVHGKGYLLPPPVARVITSIGVVTEQGEELVEAEVLPALSPMVSRRR